jgi:hypothetical protein
MYTSSVCSCVSSDEFAEAKLSEVLLDEFKNANADSDEAEAAAELDVLEFEDELQSEEDELAEAAELLVAEAANAFWLIRQKLAASKIMNRYFIFI